MSGSVKDLIRNIRGSKTASEERAVLAKECAKIRSSLNSDSVTSRRRNISKLLFINLLGYPTNFGQVECIKLIASSKFYDKRTGYLALNLLLNEDSEVLMLATNSIKIDLNDPNPYVREMALRALANVGTSEMLRELQYEIEANMANNVPNIRKKASVCTVRMLRKEANRNLTPDSMSVSLARSYLKYIEPLLSDYDNGVKLAGLSLMSVILDHYTEICDLNHFFELLIGALAQTLSANQKNFTVTIPTGSEVFTHQNVFTDQSLDDPFLKIKLLKQLKKVYLKLMSNKSHQLSESTEKGVLGESVDFDMRLVGYREKLYEIVSTIINSVKFDGNRNYAILLECVSAIDSDFAEERFNELGKLVVKKFMSGKDNNVKYLALGIIMKLHNVNMVLGDTNWTIIVQSLKQPDMSIRKKALEVSLKVVNAAILDPLLSYLYEYLLSADEDTRKESMYSIFNCVKKHSEDVAYKLQVFVKIFTIAGNSVQDLIMFDFIDLLVASGEEVKRKTTLELLKGLRYNMGQSALVKTCLYSIGEYYELLSKEDLKSVFSTYRPLSGRASEVSRSGRLGNHSGLVSEGHKSVGGESQPVGVKGSSYMSDTSNECTYGIGMNKVSNETSVDLLLDLSTPTNRSNETTRREYGTLYETTEDDLLLDVFSQENMTASDGVDNAVATKPEEMFELYDFETSTSKVPNQLNLSTLNNGGSAKSGLNVNELSSPSRACAKRTSSPGSEDEELALEPSSDQDYEAMLVELIENVTLRLLTKNLLNECEYLITCIGKLSCKMPKQVENLRKILRRFRRHSNAELQQRSCELEIMLKENIMALVGTAKKPLSELYNEEEFTVNPESKLMDSGVGKEERMSTVMLKKLEAADGVEREDDGNGNKNRDIFDEFFSTTENRPGAYQQVSSDDDVKTLDVAGTATEKDPFNMDKLSNSIVQNVSVASARENREDDFQQFDPF